jgi:hypothetical protein
MRRMEPTSSASAAEIRSRLEADFRHRLTLFYRSLQITPPYHSVEKAILAIREELANLQEPALQATVADPIALGAFFTRVVIDSGLAKKHRGIIMKVLADRPELLAPDCKPFAEAFRPQ